MKLVQRFQRKEYPLVKSLKQIKKVEKIDKVNQIDRRRMRPELSRAK